jgi:hypothetical protein
VIVSPKWNEPGIATGSRRVRAHELNEQSAQQLSARAYRRDLRLFEAKLSERTDEA